MSIMISANVYDEISSIISFYLTHSHRPSLSGALGQLNRMNRAGRLTSQQLVDGEWASEPVVVVTDVGLAL